MWLIWLPLLLSTAACFAAAAASAAATALGHDVFSRVAHICDGFCWAVGATASSPGDAAFRMDDIGPSGVFFVDIIGAHFHTGAALDALFIIHDWIPLIRHFISPFFRQIF
jgi:hypothetical protein